MLHVRELEFLDWGPLSFSVAAGECLGLSGDSGSGKSLLLRAVADLDPHGGEVSLAERSCSAMPASEWRRHVGMLPAESRWWFDTVRPHFPEQATVEFGEFGFEGGDVLEWEVRRLSVGERQRLALARLLAHGPEALLLDEPTANLDPRSTELVEGVVSRYREANSAPVVWVAHDATQLERVATRRLVLKNKRLEEVT